jgi:hypothetical protein
MDSIRKNGVKKSESEYRFCIYFSDSYPGYFDLCFHFDNLKIQIFYSTCVNGLGKLFEFIDKLDKNDKYIKLIIDEEGPQNNIILENIDTNIEDIYELRIIYNDDNYEFKKIISIESFRIKLLRAIYKLVKENIWGRENHYGILVIDNLSKYFEKYSINEYKECINCRKKLCNYDV